LEWIQLYMNTRTERAMMNAPMVATKF